MERWREPDFLRVLYAVGNDAVHEGREFLNDLEVDKQELIDLQRQTGRSQREKGGHV
jgi:hypothetical protein